MNTEEILQEVVETLKKRISTLNAEQDKESKLMASDEVPFDEIRKDPHWQRLAGKIQANEDTLSLINILQATSHNPAPTMPMAVE